jgi:anterior pharynx defective protein 1
MGATAFFGYLFLAASPLATVYTFCIARKSFLVLLSLARFVTTLLQPAFPRHRHRPSSSHFPLLLYFSCSAFYWLVTLFLISALFRGFSPLSPSIAPYVGLVLVAVLLQEAFRFLLWRFHKLSLRALEFLSTLEEHAGSELLPNDHFSLSLTHGLAHSIVHSLFFCISWLPLSLGDGTIYSASCPQMSYYLVCSLTTLGFSGILTGAMILAFEGMERQDWKRGAVLPVALHLLGGLFTLINFSQGGCVVSVSLILLEGVFVSAFAGRIWWKCTDPHLQQRQLRQRRRSSSNTTRYSTDTGVARSPRGESGVVAAQQQQHVE